MKYYEDIKGKVNTDAYIRFEPVLTLNTAVYLNDCSLVSTNINDSFSNFIKQLDDFNKVHHSSRLGAIYSFLLDKQRDSYQLDELSFEISSKVDSQLPFWAFERQSGNCFFLDIYFADRYYFPSGKVIESFYTCDVYRNSKTMKLCKKDDEDAIIYHHKGDTSKIEKVYFSNKVNLFRFQSPFIFEKHIQKLKEWYVFKMNELFKWSVNEGVILHRFNYDGLTRLQQNNAEKWNKVFTEAENMIEYEIWRLKYIDMYDEIIAQKFDALIFKLQHIIKTGHFKYGKNRKHKGYISLNTRNYKTISIYLSGFISRVKEEVAGIQNSLEY